ncbi:hypothetical protein JSCD17_36180 [Clostridioides difficile]|nr:hypothetical protein JSCD17_36180 [Clostridioides difficile]
MCRGCFEKFIVSCEDDYIKHKKEEYKKLKDDEVSYCKTLRRIVNVLYTHLKLPTNPKV